MLRTLTTLCFGLFPFFLFAQMPSDDGTVRYGNEWIDYERSYLAVRVAEDGMYRVPAQALSTAGVNGTELEVMHQGQQVPYEMIGGDVVFNGTKSRGEMDRYLFPNPDEEQLNDRFSMHSDTATYYLSAGTAGLRFTAANVSNAVMTDRLLRQRERVFSDHYTKTFFRSTGVSIYYSRYGVAEGFGSLSSGNLLSQDGNTTSETVLDLPGAIAGGGATLDLRYGTAFGGHNVVISVDGNTLLTTTRSGWNVERHSLPFITSGDETAIRLQGTRSEQDKANLAWMRVTYPAATIYDNTLNSFLLPASTTPRRVVMTDLGAAAGAGEVVKAYAPALNLVTSGQVDGSGRVTLDFPANTTATTWQLVVNDNYRTSTSAPLSFTTTLPTNRQTNYLLLTSRRLNGPAVREIADYRRSLAGGNYVVQVVNAEDLYDEFGYGIPRHPMALRNYLAAARLAAPRLQYLFLVGKGREFSDLRTEEQLTNAGETFFVPSFGFPAADNLISAALDSPVPILSTGRLAAINNNEVAIYARKLRDVEAQINQGGQTIAERDWMKQVMHLGGGGTAGEQSSIKSRLARMTDSIQVTTMAPNVTSFFKTSTEPIEDSRQEAIFDRINNGTSILTFMGHSSSQTFDFSIDDPDNYENFGKYPFMISLGCYSGDAFTEARSISERFIFLENKGAIAFAASKGVGYISALGQWGTELYLNLGTDTYGQGVGDALRESIRHFSSTSNFTLAILLEQFALSGDPAYRLHPRPGVDIIVDPTSVSFEPEVVPAQDAEFTVSLRLLNLGIKAAQDSLSLRFRQELPGGAIVELATKRVATPDYDDNYNLVLPNVGFEAVGQNRILISVDQTNDIDELPLPEAETNNEVVSGGREGISLTVVANTARVAFPPPYAVIGGELEFVASTTDVLAEARDYILQVATDRRYRNLVVNETINSPGGIIRYTPTFAPTDSTTYYWRISPDSTATQGVGFIWSESSLTWVAGREPLEMGWAVQDPGQTVDGEFTNIIADTTAFGWNFAKDVTDIKMFNALYQTRSMPRFEYNGQRFNAPHEWRIRAGLQVIVVDSINTKTDYWLRNPQGGQYNSHPTPSLVWAFDTRTQPGRAGIIQFIDEAVEVGKYVFVYSVQRGNDIEYYNEGWLQDSAELGRSIFNLLENEGSLQIGGLKDLGSVPYMFAFQKGMGALSEALAMQQTDTIFMQTDLFSNWNEGKWKSEKAGPSLGWNRLDIMLGSRHLDEQDSIMLKLMGNTTSGEEVEIREVPYNADASRTLSISLDDIEADDYPFLWVELHFFDETSRDVPTVASVYFDFDSPGDVAVNPLFAYAVTDSIEQGQPFTLTVGYENISRIGMDSLLVELSIVDEDNQVKVISQRQPSLPARAENEVTFSVSTDQTTEAFRYELRFNPRQDQPENVLFNNVLTSKTKVGNDVIAPTVMVLFDGRRINEGELVSGKPEIHIQIRDDNPYLALNDSSDYVLQITLPDGRTVRPSFSDSQIEFLPASTNENVAEIFYRPTFILDGKYIIELRGKDRSGNLAGRVDYQKAFEVINQQMVSNVLTYPNPFTTQTRFVYTLTGSEPPTMFRIQIMTVSGRVVKDIDLAAQENVRIGTHQTDYAWDGTDEYGDKLANGVYLYRVITSDSSGNSLDKYDDGNGTAQFFARDMGKVVILR
jgi:hypothetical protein